MKTWKTRFKNAERYLRHKLRGKELDLAPVHEALHRLHDMVLHHQTTQLQAQSANPLNAFGMKCFSQSDEDGITLEILRRMDLLSDGTYAEFGVGDGTENNTLILAALGWRGFWVGGEELKPKLPDNQRFSYLRDWVTLENITGLAKEGLRRVEREKLDVISLDLDGNDIYFVEALLEAGCAPKLFIVEYNAKFPPPVEFQVKYDPQHTWKGDDYFGASLTSFQKLFARFKYRLVCCNAHTGGNAFFVHEAYADRFQDVPTDVHALYKGPRYWLYHQYGHPNSVKTIENLFGA